VSVINAAVTGYSLFQSYKYLEMRGLDLKPDMVMIYHGRNDFFSTAFTASRAGSPTSESGLSDLEIAAERARFPNDINLYLHYNSFAYRWIRSRWSLQARDSAREYKRGTRPRVSESERREILERIQRLLEERHTRFVILVPAYLSFAKHRTVLIDFSRRTGVPAIDLEPVVASAGRERSQLFFEDELHPRPSLHRAFAQSILEFLWHEENARGLAECLYGAPAGS
jgi:lysophospholipase L1-like esterase